MRLLSKIVLLCGVSTAAALAASVPVTISLSAENPIVKPGSEVYLKIQLMNSSAYPIDCGKALTDGLDRAYQYDVHLEGGVEAPKRIKKHPEIGDEFSAYPCTVQPGETADITAGAISRLFDMTQPGKYEVQASRTVMIDGKSYLIKSNKITVVVAK